MVIRVMAVVPTRGQGMEAFVYENTVNTEKKIEWQYNFLLNTQTEDFLSSLPIDHSNSDQVSIASKESWVAGPSLLPSWRNRLYLQDPPSVLVENFIQETQVLLDLCDSSCEWIQRPTNYSMVVVIDIITIINKESVWDTKKTLFMSLSSLLVWMSCPLPPGPSCLCTQDTIPAGPAHTRTLRISSYSCINLSSPFLSIQMCCHVSHLNKKQKLLRDSTSLSRYRPSLHSPLHKNSLKENSRMLKSIEAGWWEDVYYSCYMF